jgi:hypothetical protein
MPTFHKHELRVRAGKSITHLISQTDVHTHVGQTGSRDEHAVLVVFAPDFKDGGLLVSCPSHVYEREISPHAVIMSEFYLTNFIKIQKIKNTIFSGSRQNKI